MGQTLTIIGDPHCKPDNLDKINVLFDMIEDLGNTTIILGDLFDTKEVVRGRCLNLVYERLKASKLQFWILVGNHDWFNLECKEHSLEVLKSISNVVIVDRPMELTTDIAMIPYVHDLQDFRKILSSYNCKFLFMHQGVNGFDYGNGFVATEEVDPKSLKKFKKVISGHFHKMQDVGNLIYPGTPFSHSFGETDQDKFIMLFEPDTGKYELIPTPFQKHRTFVIDLSKPEVKIPKSDSANWRIVLTGTKAQLAAFDRSLLDCFKVIERVVEEEEDFVLTEDLSNEEKFVKWGREVAKVSDDTIQLGLKILEEVR